MAISEKITKFKKLFLCNEYIQSTIQIDQRTSELRNLLLDPKSDISTINKLYEEIIIFVNSSECQSLQNTNVIVFIIIVILLIVLIIDGNK